MSGDASTPVDEQFTELLVACDEALAAGTASKVLTDTNAPIDLRSRLERGVACLHLLEQFWSTRPKPDGVAGASLGITSLTHLGRFQIRRELGQGSFGRVFLAHDPLLGRDVALKIPRVPALLTPELRQRFHHEAMAAARLDHPNLVPVYDAGVVDDICFITSPYCPGTTLAAWLQQRGLPVPWSEAATILVILAEAVQHAHSRGVLHRDLKPANILLDPNPNIEIRNPKPEEIKPRMKHGVNTPPSQGGDTRGVRSVRVPSVAANSDFGIRISDFQPKITDFGLAKLLEEGQVDQTGTGMIVGSPCYMAPEQAEGKNKEITTAADVYALGAILYEMLTSRPPFLADSALTTLEQVRTQEPVPPRRLQPQVPRDLETICLKCLQKDPHRRYVSAYGLAEDLRRLLAGEPIQARAVGPGERLLKWAKRRPAPAAVVSVTCLAAALLTFLSVGFNFRLSQEKKATDLALEREVQTNTELTQALQRVQQTLYFHRISLAHHEWLSNNVARTQELLEACPPELRQWEWRYLKRLGESGFATFQAHTGAVSSVAFDPKGKRVASGSWDSTVRVWDADTRQVLRILRGHTGPIEGVAFSPDGQRIASASRDGTVKVWDASTGNECYTLRGHRAEVSSVAFSPDGERLASASWDRTVKFWDLSTRRAVHSLEHSDRVFCVTFSPDGRRLASGSNDVRVWDAKTGARLLTCSENPADPLIWVSGVSFHPDGRRLASANGNNTVHIWDSSTGKALDVLRGHGPSSVCFSPDGERLASAGYDQSVTVWNTASGAELHTLRGHTALWVSSVAWAPDGQRLASGSADWTVRVWDTLTSQEALTIPGGRHLQVACSGDGRFIATAGRYKDQAVVVWEAATARQLVRLRGHVEFVASVAFRPDSSYLASAADKTVKIWDTKTWKEVATFQDSQPIVKVAYSPDGKRLASASWDKTVKIWDPATRQVVMPLNGHTAAVNHVAFSLDGKYLATASEDKTIRIWNAATGEALHTLPGPLLGVTSVAFDPTGKLVAAGSKDATVKVWNPETGELAFTCKGHTAAVWDIVFSPDGRRLASASDDYTVKLWDTATGDEALTLRVDLNSVFSVVFSPDGTRLLCGTNFMKIWEALPAAER
jgi:WD40 repeat protein/serine/threonine protein kinase